MLDSPRVDALKLRFNDNGTELALGPGMHGIGRGGDDAIGLVSDQQSPLLRFCVDRRGVWLIVADGVRGIHVNGRPVRRMAMLRPGDAIHAEGSELTLMRDEPPANSALPDVADTPGDLRLVLRGVGGPHHGRSVSLEAPRRIGSAANADLHIEGQGIAAEHALIEVANGQAVLRHANADVLVNGLPQRQGVLYGGDQLTFGVQHRFVLEGPPASLALPPCPRTGLHDAQADAPPTPPHRGWAQRVPWLLVSALLLAAALSALLLFGAR